GQQLDEVRRRGDVGAGCGQPAGWRTGAEPGEELELRGEGDAPRIDAGAGAPGWAAALEGAEKPGQDRLVTGGGRGEEGAQSPGHILEERAVGRAGKRRLAAGGARVKADDPGDRPSGRPAPARRGPPRERDERPVERGRRHPERPVAERPRER